MYVPKVLIGTLYCSEGDLQKCVAAIRSQDSVAIEHVMICHKPELEAHNELWSTWHDRRDNSGFDLFIKCDADTILFNRFVIKDVWDLLNKNVSATGVQAPLYDCLSQTKINGLNCFTRKVSFKTGDDLLYCDRADIGNTNVLRGDKLPKKLNPAGYHCALPSDIQAFHYGLHRALKGQHELIASVARAWQFQANKDPKASINRQRAFAIIGAKKAGEQRFSWHEGGFNYDDEKFLEAFEEALNEMKR